MNEDTMEPINIAYQEICKLAGMLSDAGVSYCIERAFDGWHLIYPNGGNVCSVIEHRTSMGSSQDRLEIMGLLNKEERKFDKVVGYLTAENVYERILRHWERRKGRNE